MSQAEAAFEADGEGGSRSFARRVIGAVRLEPAAWDEIASEGNALVQAALVVLVAAAASGFAAASTGSTALAAESALGSLSSWLLVAGLLWVASRALGHRLGFGTGLRVVGFAMAPLALFALAALPIAHVEAVVRMVALALFFAGLVAGTRQALGVETMRATLVCAAAGLGLVFLTLLAVALSVSAA